MIPPTIGRAVLVYRNHRVDPVPALIACVWNDRMINVGGFDQNGVPFALTSLQLLQDDDPVPSSGVAYAAWMPYQKGQAAKTEQLQQQLASGAMSS